MAVPPPSDVVAVPLLAETAASPAADAPGPAPTPWGDALLAAALLATDPAAIGGVWLRASAGPVRDRWLAQLAAWLGPERVPLRLPLHIRDERLLGGLDLAATLRSGRPVAEGGLLARADGRVVLAAMAERIAPSTAARLVAVLDRGELRLERDGLARRWPARFGLVALDEGQSDDERPPAALPERLGLWLDLGALSLRDAAEGVDLDAAALAAARERAPRVRAGDAVVGALCEAAVALGVPSLRAPLLALAAARVHAALHGRDEVETDDARAAARLVLAPRATRLPAPSEQAAPETDDRSADAAAPPPPDPPDPLPPPERAADAAPDADDDPPPPAPESPLDDQVLQAAAAAIPPGLLARLKAAQAGRERARAGGKAGAWQRDAARGRPAGTRRGEPRGGQRLHLIDTLRAAAPWQRLRRTLADDADANADTAAAAAADPSRPGAARIRVLPQDFHVTRLRQRRETTTLFVVDASGSAALHRLAEAKGAVELLLADCYVRRDRVAVIAFRGRAAELLLPPTRSLVRAKRALAGLPGGGGTPLAAAIDAAAELARSVRRHGQTPLLVLLTDGRANVARDGSGGRERAADDARAAARRLAADGLAALLVDTSPQPAAAAVRLAAEMGATYLPLPRAGAAEVSSVVQAHSRAARGGRAADSTRATDAPGAAGVAAGTPVPAARGAAAAGPSTRAAPVPGAGR
jgi:magnesium chelatase subunit D